MCDIFILKKSYVFWHIVTLIWHKSAMFKNEIRIRMKLN